MSIKSFNIPINESDFGWDVYGGKEAVDNELYARVAAVFRAIQLNSDALASLPFALVSKKSGEDYDISTEWQNKVGFFPKPESILKLWRTSLSMTNSAYGFMERSKGETELRYIVPSSIEPVVKDPEGLVGFIRQVNGRRTPYALDSGVVRHIFRLDYDTEILPSENTEFQALMSAAGILFYSDQFAMEFFKRGGVKPTILSIKGMPTKDERTRIETYWNRFMKGFYKVQGKVFNADTFTAIPVGDGVAELKDNPVYRQSIENVAMATGIPLSLMLSNSANFATAEAEMKLWFDWSVIPWSKFIARELNENLWSDFGLRMEFRPEQVDPDATETQLRAETYNVLVATLPRSVAAQIAGLTMPENVLYEDLDNLEGEVDTEEPEVDEVETPQEQPGEVRAFSMDQYKELKNWCDLATRKHKRGELAEMTWEVKELPADIGEEIKATLATAETIEDVKAAFDVTGAKKKEEKADPKEIHASEDIKALADALNSFANKAEPINLTVNSAPITVNTPEQEITITPEVKAAEPASVVVNVPEQPAPNVAVTNVVETPEVTVNNDVTVKPADVVMKSPKRVKVVKERGKIVGLESE